MKIFYVLDAVMLASAAFLFFGIFDEVGKKDIEFFVSGIVYGVYIMQRVNAWKRTR